jgi:hypothetical protein
LHALREQRRPLVNEMQRGDFIELNPFPVGAHRMLAAIPFQFGRVLIVCCGQSTLPLDLRREFSV